MEFKKSNQYSNGRTRLAVPQRSETPPVVAPTPKPEQSPEKRKRASPRKLIGAAIFAVFILGVVVSALVINARVPRTDTGILTNPGYETVLPSGKSIKKLGGWERVSPPASDPVYAYADRIDTVSISVSEQPLPESFKSDTAGKVAELAKTYNATKKVTADAVTVYIGTSAQGPQSVIFVKNDLLVLIKSQKNIKDASWTDYITSLR